MSAAVQSQNLATNIGFGHESAHTKFESWAQEIPIGRMQSPIEVPLRIDVDRAVMKSSPRAGDPIGLGFQFNIPSRYSKDIGVISIFSKSVERIPPHEASGEISSVNGFQQLGQWHWTGPDRSYPSMFLCPRP